MDLLGLALALMVLAVIPAAFKVAALAGLLAVASALLMAAAVVAVLLDRA